MRQFNRMILDSKARAADRRPRKAASRALRTPDLEMSEFLLLLWLAPQSSQLFKRVFSLLHIGMRLSQHLWFLAVTRCRTYYRLYQSIEIHIQT
jgi:hypothetical protein